jgi:hypothetical protein
MFFLTNLLEHTRAFRSAVQQLGGTGEFDLASLSATVRVGTAEVRFQPQFLERRPDGSLTYGVQWSETTGGFIGWLPYFNKRWPEAFDKLAFKRRCQATGLPTPGWTVGGPVAAELGDCLIKRARGSSFGSGMRGPFAAADAATLSLTAGEYAEHFAPGLIGKAWYWNDRVVAIELAEPASVVGDGLATLAELVRRARVTADVTTVPDFFHYRGLSWADVPARGDLVVIDFKYASSYVRYTASSTNRMQELQHSALVAQLDQWGPVFWSWVPEPIRRGTLYTADFVISASNGLLLLELNCNPMVPPEAYGVIVSAAFSGEVQGLDTVLPAAAVGAAAPMIFVPPPQAVAASDPVPRVERALAVSEG